MKKVLLLFLLACCRLTITCAQDGTLKIYSPPMLVYPADGEQIRTLLPVLQWLPPQPFTPGTTKYIVKLVEVSPGQDAQTALNENPALLEQGDLGSTSLACHPSFTSLSYGHLYAWEVSAYEHNESRGKTEAWTFTPSADPLHKDSTAHHPVTVVQSHWITQDQLDNGFVIADSAIKFTYLNHSNLTSLSYKIARISTDQNGALVPAPAVPVRYGLNYLTIPTQGMSLIPGSYYLLTIVNPDGSRRNIKILAKPGSAQ